MKTLLILVAAIVLSCGAAWGEYMVVHAPAKSDFFSGSIIQIDPGINPSYKYESSKRITKKFDTLKEVVDYLNDVKPDAIEVYKIEPVNLKQHERVINRKVVEDKETQWTLEGEEPVWRAENVLRWRSSKEDFGGIIGDSSGVTVLIEK